MSPKLRVIAGTLKGRAIEVPKTTRPTLALVRRGIFDHLGPVVVGARIMDLFAGTGALGIEALSRGAREVWFVERSQRAIKTLRNNVEQLNLREYVQIVPMLVEDFLNGPPPEPFDLAFADPPYAFRRWGDFLDRLYPWIRPEGLVVCEMSVRTPFAVSGFWDLHWERAYGETLVRIYRRLPRDL